ncbi:helicase SNF2 [Aeromicrobium sp. SMF47]|nr:helicase SNF2 [Aeromicrobium yanjiei]
MRVTTIASLTESELRRAFDAGALSRGKPYARAGRVTVREIEADGRVARGEVRGSGAEAYSTTVRLSEAPAGVRISASCSCPVMIDCKHAVALILAVRGSIEPADAVEEEPEPIDRPAPRPAQIIQPSWKTTLGPLAARGSGSRASTEWALQIDLTGAGTYGIRMLSARPMRRGARGGWVKSGASWGEVQQAALAGVDSGQAAALAELRASVQETSYAYGYGGSSAEIDLADLTPHAWAALDRVVESGVTLLGPAKAAVEIRPEPVTAGLEIVQDHSGDLHVRATLSDDALSDDWEQGHTSLIGQPAHGIATWDAQHPTVLRLVRFDHTIADTVRVLLANRRSVNIPPQDAAEFLRDYYPRIARAVDLVSVDPRIPVPEIAPPRLSVTVTHDGLAAELRWGFAYVIDDSIVRVPLGAGAEPFRDVRAERELVGRLVPPDVGLPLTHVDAAGRTKVVPRVKVDGYEAAVLSQQLLPALDDLGIDVHVIGTRPDYRLSESEPVVHVTLDDAPDRRSDWYDLAVTVTIDGEKVPFEQLFAALAAGETHLVLPSGTYLLIDRPELLRLRDLIDEARQLTDRRSEQLRVNRYHAGLWDELVNLGTVDRQSASWQKAVGSLQQIDDLGRPEVPEGIDAQLRPYQTEGFAWLCFLADHGLGGILADDMGLGKTLQTLALMVREVERGSGPYLVVAPTSVVSNWEREAHRFAPGLRVAAITQSRARRGTELADAVKDADLVVTSYALFRIENDAYAARTWSGLVLDEAQFVKNHQGKTYQCARRLDAPFKLAITGTPLENSLMDLWSMLSIVAPGLFPDPKRFVTHYQKPIESGEGRERLALLQRRIRPLMRRRTKEEVASDLPTKTEQVLEVALNPRHARIYQTHLQRERQKVLGLLADDADGNRFEVLSSLTKLRQLSLDPALIDEEHDDVGSAKIDVLVEHLQEVTSEGHGALVFSQFTSFLGRVRSRLDQAGITYSYLDGSTRDRAGAVDAFRAGETSVFLISLKAGGFGLNLVEADYVYVLDPWWNPASEAQAVDRAHRIGQIRPVMVYRLVSVDTIEEKVMQLKARKAALFDAVMDDGAALSGALSSDDIRGLLGA